MIPSPVSRSLLERLNHSFHIGCGITDIVTMYDSTSGTGSTHTIFLDREHRYNSVASLQSHLLVVDMVTELGSKKTCITLVLGFNTNGQKLRARITVNAAGEMTGVKIMDGGCNYEVGQVLNVTGTALQQLVTLSVKSLYNILIIILVIPLELSVSHLNQLRI